MSRYRNWTIHPFLYFIGAALCFGAGGYGCDQLPNTATGFGIGCGGILLAIVLIVRGIIAYDS